MAWQYPQMQKNNRWNRARAWSTWNSWNSWEYGPNWKGWKGYPNQEDGQNPNQEGNPRKGGRRGRQPPPKTAEEAMALWQELTLKEQERARNASALEVPGHIVAAKDDWTAMDNPGKQDGDGDDIAAQRRMYDMMQDMQEKNEQASIEKKEMERIAELKAMLKLSEQAFEDFGGPEKRKQIEEELARLQPATPKNPNRTLTRCKKKIEELDTKMAEAQKTIDIAHAEIERSQLLKKQYQQDKHKLEVEMAEAKIELAAEVYVFQREEDENVMKVANSYDRGVAETLRDGLSQHLHAMMTSSMYAEPYNIYTAKVKSEGGEPLQPMQWLLTLMKNLTPASPQEQAPTDRQETAPKRPRQCPSTPIIKQGGVEGVSSGMSVEENDEVEPKGEQAQPGNPVQEEIPAQPTEEATRMDPPQAGPARRKTTKSAATGPYAEASTRERDHHGRFASKKRDEETETERTTAP